MLLFFPTTLFSMAAVTSFLLIRPTMMIQLVPLTGHGQTPSPLLTKTWLRGLLAVGLSYTSSSRFLRQTDMSQHKKI